MSGEGKSGRRQKEGEKTNPKATRLNLPLKSSF